MTEVKKTPKKPLIYYAVLALLMLLLFNALVVPALRQSRTKEVDYVWHLFRYGGKRRDQPGGGG